ncbi:zinc finger BED domain-containing protein RICESLEEPER 2-like [Tasmannia lanceolata]|uniref:zinc finger BED domain-containing protein RICESLEEPER 2-like n=1 Tax=Tasmannia lanceolata TaxID=3420 RepID=UPI0040644F08
MSQEGASTPNVSDQSSNPIESSQMIATSLKRKSMKPRSDVWDHYTKFVDEEGEHKSRCGYCEKEFHSDPRRNGTSALKTHISSCKKSPPPNINTKQTQLNYQPIKGQEGDGSGTLTNWKFDQEAIRNALARMIIVDEIPFKFVENEGFRDLMSVACPRFCIPSRSTITRDCFQFFLNESHKGEAIGKAVEKCLLEWGIDKVFTIYVDNASSNDVAVGYLKRRINNWGTSVLQGKYLHMRCIAHIINLVVCDGLKEVGISVDLVRAAVRYVRGSPARLKLLKECVEFERIQSKSSLCLDVSTRWNSTYLMLNAAEKFEKAFERSDDQDPYFTSELDSGDLDGIRKPNREDWEAVRRMTILLQNFYDLTIRVSGSLYVTSNSLFHKIREVQCLLQQWSESGDFKLVMMGRRMKGKYDKYWGDIEKLNKLIYIVVVLDPRNKVDFVKFALIDIYGDEKGKVLGAKVFDATFEMFNELSNKNTSNTTHGNQLVHLGDSSSSENSQKSQPQEPKHVRKMLTEKYKKHRIESGGGDNKSELDRYLTEDVEDDSDKFDILAWWKLHSPRFPILLEMARSVLAVLISTVASESAFSTGGRVLDAFRSSLTPKIVQALICTQDWLRSISMSINVEEALEDFEIFENEFSTSTIGEFPSNIDL